jgi:hypothetical protein
MSAHAYISYSDVPNSVIASSRQRVHDETKEMLIAFDDCPLTGVIHDDEGGAQEIEFPFPRAPEIRNSLVGWFMKWSISFQVVT